MDRTGKGEIVSCSADAVSNKRFLLKNALEKRPGASAKKPNSSPTVPYGMKPSAGLANPNSAQK